MKKQTIWINLNAWTASLVASVHAKGQKVPDFSLYGIWTIRTGLEGEGDAPLVALAAAAAWFAYAAPTIYQLCMESKTFEGKLARSGSMFREREWRGFSQSRWATWVRQMGQRSEVACDEKTRELVSMALKAMEAADGASCSRR